MSRFLSCLQVCTSVSEKVSETVREEGQQYTSEEDTCTTGKGKVWQPWGMIHSSRTFHVALQRFPYLTEHLHCSILKTDLTHSPHLSSVNSNKGSVYAPAQPTSKARPRHVCVIDRTPTPPLPWSAQKRRRFKKPLPAILILTEPRGWQYH